MTDNFNKLMKAHEESPENVQKQKKKKAAIESNRLGCGVLLLAIFGSIITGFWPGLFIFSLMFILWVFISEKVWE
ncbi:MAG: hypothetical protein OXG88_00300 [Gammaproteobacteria bacterium]|nr:hypothetical protein [Gammaproteobacteria bacterium]